MLHDDGEEQANHLNGYSEGSLTDAAIVVGHSDGDGVNAHLSVSMRRADRLSGLIHHTGRCRAVAPINHGRMRIQPAGVGERS